MDEAGRKAYQMLQMVFVFFPCCVAMAMALASCAPLLEDVSDDDQFMFHKCSFFPSSIVASWDGDMENLPTQLLRKDIRKSRPCMTKQFFQNLVISDTGGCTNPPRKISRSVVLINGTLSKGNVCNPTIIFQGFLCWFSGGEKWVPPELPSQSRT